MSEYRPFPRVPSGPERARQEVEDELAHHIELRSRELVERGVPESAARDRALAEFGDVQGTREYCERSTERRIRRARTRGAVDMVREELKHAWRQVRRHPGFTLAAVLTLALGIGANTAIFSAVHTVLLRPLPFARSGELVRVYAVKDGGLWTSSPANYLDWRTQNDVFVDLAAHSGRSYTVTGPGADPERITGARVTASLFDVLGVRPRLGRTFTGSDEVAGGEPVVLLSEGLWRRRFGGDPGVVGESMVLDGSRHTVIGVIPDSAAYPSWARLWTPLVLSEEAWAARGTHYLGVSGRLRPGVPLERARGDMREIAARLAAEYPEQNREWTAEVMPLHETIVGGVRTPLLVLLGAVGLVLLIACVNVASLLVARGLGRRRELAIRASIGASRRRIFGSLLAENLLLAGLGGVVGIGVAHLLIRALTAAQAAEGGLGGLIATQAVPRLADAGLSVPVLAFGLGVTVVTGLAFGTLPALRSAMALDPAEGLKRGEGGGVTGRSRLRGGLVVAQIALAVVLLAGAGLLLRSFLELTRVDPGFRTEGVLTARLSLPEDRYDTPEAVETFFAGLLERLESLPDVERAAAAFALPLTGFNFSIAVEELDGRPLATQGADKPSLQVRVVTADYFDVMEIPVIAGRGFAETDRHGTPQVALLNESAARLLWPDGDPLGGRARVGMGFGLDRGQVGGQVVGVVRDFKHFGLAAPVPPEIYVLHRQFPVDDMSLVLRTRRPPMELVPSVRGALQDLDPNLPLEAVRSMASILAGSVARRRFVTTLLGVFAAAALGLASVGIYGLMAFTVRRRTREIGIRMAMGASTGDVVGMIARRAAWLAGLGSVIGALLAAVATRPLGTLLYRLEPGDPLTLGAAILALLATALIAAALPAWRGARVDPMSTLKTE